MKDRNDATTIFDARKTYAALDNEVYFISKRVFDIISQIQKSHPTVAIDVSNTTIFNSDAKAIDFAKIDVSYAFIDQVDLTHSNLTPIKFASLNLGGSNWWDAAAIDQNLLEYATQTFYPGYIEGEVICSNVELTKAYYAQRISALCVPRRPLCNEENLRFEERFHTWPKPN